MAGFKADFGGLEEDPFAGFLVNMGVPTEVVLPKNLPQENYWSLTTEDRRALDADLQFLFQEAVIKAQDIWGPRQNLEGFLRFSDRVVNETSDPEHLVAIRTVVERSMLELLAEGSSWALLEQCGLKLNECFQTLTLGEVQDYLASNKKVLYAPLSARVEQRLRAVRLEEVEQMVQENTLNVDLSGSDCWGIRGQSVLAFRALPLGGVREAWTAAMIQHCDTPDKLDKFLDRFIWGEIRSEGYLGLTDALDRFPVKLYFEKLCAFELAGKRPSKPRVVPDVIKNVIKELLQAVKKENLLEFTALRGIWLQYLSFEEAHQSDLWGIAPSFKDLDAAPQFQVDVPSDTSNDTLSEVGSVGSCVSSKVSEAFAEVVLDGNSSNLSQKVTNPKSQPVTEDYPLPDKDLDALFADDLEDEGWLSSLQVGVLQSILPDVPTEAPAKAQEVQDLERRILALSSVAIPDTSRGLPKRLARQ